MTAGPLDDGGGLLSPALRATTVGALALVSLHAFEALALTTVMPTIARELQGESLYAMAFTATLAAGIVSIVWSGNLADRRGPRPPLVIGLVLFTVGLVVAGLSPTMPVLVGARIVQGLGAGLHTAILAGFSAAWVVPSIAGPFVAGLITQTIGWRWVFGLAIVVLVVAALLLARVLSGRGQELVDVPWRWGALGSSTVLAVAVLVLNLVAEQLDSLAVGLAVLVALVALVAVVLSLRPLLPPRALLAARGLPSAVLLRGLAFGAFTGAEVYLPRLLTDRDGFSPTLAGVALTLTGVSWFAGSWVQGAWDTRFEIGRTAAFSLGLLTLTLAGLAVALAAGAPAWLVIAIFPLLGFGIGTLYPRVTAHALGRADGTQQGFVSSALQISDSAGAATALALSAIVFAAAGSGVPTAYVAVFAVMAGPALVGWLVAHRVR